MAAWNPIAWLAAPARLRGRGWLWLLIYVAAAAVVLGAGAWAALRHERDLIDWLAGYLFPESWRPAAQVLVTRFFETQEKEILVNLVVNGGLVAVSLLLFPVKEKLSATFEREAQLTGDEGAGFSLLFEASEEIKLFLFFLAAQTSIFWLGYSPDPAPRALALVLSYLTLFASFAMDFITPILQRHGVRFSTAAKLLARHPFSALGFGAVFAAPAALAGGLAARGGEWGIGGVVALICAINIVAIAWAAVSGTALGARLLPAAAATRRPSAVTRAIAWLLLGALLAWNSYRFAAVGVSLHRKSALLRCDYQVDWKSLDLGPTSIAFDVKVRNPTDRTLEIEDNTLVLAQGDQVVATSSLPVFSVPAGGEVVVPARFRLSLSPRGLLRGRELLRREGWTLTLTIAAAPGFELPIYLLKGSP